MTAAVWQFTNLSWTMNVNALPADWLGRNPHGVIPSDGRIAFFRRDGSHLVTDSDFHMAELSKHLMARPEWPISTTDHVFYVETPPIHGPTFEGEPLHAYWTVDGEHPVLVPVASMVIKGRVRVLTEAVTVSPTGEIVYDGNRYLTGTAPMADGGQARIVITQGQDRRLADFPVDMAKPSGVV